MSRSPASVEEAARGVLANWMSLAFAADGQANTLPHYWDMEQLTDDGRYGRVYSEGDFLRLFGGVIGNGAAGPSDA